MGKEGTGPPAYWAACMHVLQQCMPSMWCMMLLVELLRAELARDSTAAYLQRLRAFGGMMRPFATGRGPAQTPLEVRIEVHVPGRCVRDPARGARLEALRCVRCQVQAEIDVWVAATVTYGAAERHSGSR